MVFTFPLYVALRSYAAISPNLLPNADLFRQSLAG